MHCVISIILIFFMFYSNEEKTLPVKTNWLVLVVTYKEFL